MIPNSPQFHFSIHNIWSTLTFLMALGYGFNITFVYSNFAMFTKLMLSIVCVAIFIYKEIQQALIKSKFTIINKKRCFFWEFEWAFLDFFSES